MAATFLVNTGPILAGNTANLSVDDLNSLYAAGNEIAGHTLDHVNVQPLSTADAEERDLYGSEQPPPHGISEQLPTHFACLPVRLVR